MRYKNNKNLCLFFTALLLTVPISAQETAESWYEEGRAVVERNLSYRYPNAEIPIAKNVILFVGDGMGVSTVTAARILEGQINGDYGEENELFFETFPNVALSKTYNTDSQVPDSAGTMSAMVTGIKTDRGILSINQKVTRSDCSSSIGNEVPTFLEIAEQKGLSTGVVSTARITHATPAANYSHSVERDHESDRNSERLTDPINCKDIAAQLIELSANLPGSDGIEVALGGGRRNFLQRIDGADPETGGQGERLDGRDLTQEWVELHENSAYVWNKSEFDDVDVDATEHLLGLFQPSHMQYAYDNQSDEGGEPTLSEMTSKAIDLLSKNDKGFYLNVEGGRIDHAHHALNPFRALMDTIEFSRAVKTAFEKVDLSETLIIVTADHSHTLTIAGYPGRGNPILGKVNAGDEPRLAGDGLPYTTLGYINGRGQRTDLTNVDTADESYRSEALIPLASETHGGEDVPIYAVGAGSDLVRGVMEQHVIFHVMMEASKMATR